MPQRDNMRSSFGDESRSPFVDNSRSSFGDGEPEALISIGT